MGAEAPMKVGAKAAPTRDRGQKAAPTLNDVRATADVPLALKNVAIAKLEAAATPEAVAVLAEAAWGLDGRGQKPPPTREKMTNEKWQMNNDKFCSASALAALCRMKTNAARGAVREVLESKDGQLVLTAVDLVGALGDAAMLPLLEQLEAGLPGGSLRQVYPERKRRGSGQAGDPPLHSPPASDQLKSAVQRARAQIGMRKAAHAR